LRLFIVSFSLQDLQFRIVSNVNDNLNEILQRDQKKSEESSAKIMDLLEAQGHDLLELKQIIVSGLLRTSQINRMVEEAENHPKVIEQIITDRAEPVSSNEAFVIQELTKIDFKKLKLATKKLLGKGTSAKVFECQYGEKLIAVKQIQDFDNLKEDEAQRVRREVLLLQHMSHKNIIQFFGADLEKGMFLLELGNTSLHQVIHQKKPLPNMGKFNITMKCRIAYEVSCALRYIHSLNIIHRDLKPDNVLLLLEKDPSSTGNMGVVAKLADFGLAKVLESASFWQTEQHSTNPITDVGSKAYMAPEGFSTKKDISGESLKAMDMYSFGVFLNELLGEELPWEEKVSSVVAMKEKIQNGERPTLFTQSKNWKNVLQQEPARNSIVPELAVIIGNNNEGLFATKANVRFDAKNVCKQFQQIGQKIPGFAKVV
jgi:serine/threonine protein kinase